MTIVNPHTSILSHLIPFGKPKSTTIKTTAMKLSTFVFSTMLALQTSAQKITVCQVELWGADSTKPSDTAWVSPGGIARFTVKFGRHSLFLYAKTSDDCTPSPVLEGPSRWGTHTIRGSLQEKQKGTVLVQEVSMKEATRGYP